MAQITATSAGAIILREVDGQLKIALAHPFLPGLCPEREPTLNPYRF